ncbi:MAG: hypothetical protein IKJ68_05510 [Clostridia bacterium]|nr:hypothetical protein [Clostridia bacterium]
MYKRYYDGYERSVPPRNSGEVVVPQSLDADNENIATEITSVPKDSLPVSVAGNNSLLSSLPFELDDLILIGILLFLLFDKNDCKKDDDNDMFVLLIIGFIIFSDILT